MLHTYIQVILLRVFFAPCTIIDMLFLNVRRGLSADNSAFCYGRTRRSLVYLSRGQLGIIEMLQSRLVALLRSSELHPSHSQICATTAKKT